ncbi:HAD family hydrolase [Actinoplanes sp. N902-109]|uniref:HAD-IIIC family phosphatase n=1 Tax=Actinoplanes sp. (strain N902-109) TaxID=649831 RepID=UPI0003295D6E|nr:HAD-IIIC family phosphatase [Actinoplanes sp. N902-109]AGL16011.1 FkbH domain protein [Actinoplanes sp. N902-109]
MADKPIIVKCLVWDLDNTVWNGTLLEDPGVDVLPGIREAIIELDSRGVLQSVASKNDHDMAWAHLEKLGLAEYFVHPQISWGPKSDAVKTIAERLNFAIDTIAFIDDLPTERAEVTYHHPEVRTYSHDQATALAGLPEFSPEVVTVDARRRREMYQAGFRRDAEKDTFKGADEDFLRSLDLVMAIKRADQDDLSRVEELTLRTSQMNATGVHYSDATLRQLLADPDHEVLTVTLSDRFGPHGAVGVILLRYHPEVWNLKLLATSCRVVTFGAGSVLLNWLIDQAAQAGAHLAADFRQTDRNRMMDIAYRFAGFTGDACDCIAELDPLADNRVQRLHLLPERREGATTMQVSSPELAADLASRTYGIAV